jgi:F-type H+-transporting ATPase subunit epsilon
MADPKPFDLAVITPERAVLRSPATFVAIPAWDGEIGVLANRAPLLVKLGVGWLRADTPEGKKTYLIDGGFAQVVDNKVSVLTERAQAPEEIDAKTARRDLAEAKALPVTDDASFEARQRALARARAEVRATR